LEKHVDISDTNPLNEPAANAKPQSSNLEPDLSLYEIIQVLLDYRTLAIAITTTILIGSTVYAFTATPIYRAEITLGPARGQSGGLSSMISSFGGALGGLASMAGIGAGGGGSQGSRLMRGEAKIALVSPSHIQGFITDNNLLPILFESKWDAEMGVWIDESPEAIPTLSDGYDIFTNRILKLEVDPLTNILVLAVEWKDPDLAASWANDIVGSLNAALRAKAIRDTDKTNDFLTQELERTKVLELRQAIFYMIERNIGSKTTARVSDEFAFKIIDPALAPDEDKYIHPEKGFIIFLGLLSGLVAGIFGAFFAYAITRLRNEYLLKLRAT
jgi:hypothetical protein